MARVAVVTDSTSCLPRELVQKYDIGVIPLLIVKEGRTYRDGLDITPGEVYQIMRKREALPTTSIPSIGDVLEIFRHSSKKAEHILCITVTGKQSKVFDSALTARSMLIEEQPATKIEVVDSRAVAGALGFIVLAAAKAAAEGASLEQTVDTVKNMIPRVNAIFMLDTLYYLARTGRIGRATAWAGALLDMKPIVEHSTATAETMPVQRTRTRSKAVRRLAEIMDERVGKSPVHVMVHHADELDEAKRLRAWIESHFNFIELYITDFTPAMGVHAGPGVVGLSFYVD